MSVRVRYAPSPTGFQHIGGIRTALFNYFFARSAGGSFILRVEDTDRERSAPEALKDLYSTLQWLGVDWDEGPGKGGDFGPYIQSERRSIYTERAEELIASGSAYRCFCGPERLDALRAEQSAAKAAVIGYDRHCRSLSPSEADSRAAAGEPHVIRLKVPTEGKTHFSDIIMGSTGRKNRDISPDPVLIKTDGFPTYHLANVVDDHMMGITHIMRAQEWIPSAPLHILIYRSFGWSPPLYCHLPMVMGKDGRKLSKRHGSTALREFRDDGYLPEALINFITLLGWHYDSSREFFTSADLCRLFTLEKISKAPAVFDYRKLEWFNGHYIRGKTPDSLKAELLGVLSARGLIENPPSNREKEIFQGAFPIIRERLKRLGDVVPMLRFLFADPGTGDIAEAIPKSMDARGAAAALREGIRLLESAPSPPPAGEGEAAEEAQAEAEHSWEAALEAEFRREAENRGWKIGAMLQPLRLALTASRVSPPLFPSIRLLGLEESLRRARRLNKALELN